MLFADTVDIKIKVSAYQFHFNYQQCFKEYKLKGWIKKTLIATTGENFFCKYTPMGERERKKALEGKGKDHKNKFIHPSEEEPLLVDIGDLRI